jgi:hypothetical protein
LGRRRPIDREADRALELLRHAVEYLADEYVHASRSVSAEDFVLCAIRILMARNRESYFACPVVPALGERLLALLGWQRV